MKLLLASLTLVSLLLPLPLHSRPREVFKIEIGGDYQHYSKKELRRRVWQLERAVSQLQDQVFQLAMDNNRPHYGSGRPWTCHIQSFGETFTAGGGTRASAVAQVLQKCSKASSSIHCKEKDASCDNK